MCVGATTHIPGASGYNIDPGLSGTLGDARDAYNRTWLGTSVVERMHGLTINRSLIDFRLIDKNEVFIVVMYGG